MTSFGLKSPEQTQDEADLEDQKFDHALDAIKQGKPITQFKQKLLPG